jgi:hypothetical protein
MNKPQVCKHSQARLNIPAGSTDDLDLEAVCTNCGEYLGVWGQSWATSIPRRQSRPLLDAVQKARHTVRGYNFENI